MGKMRRYSRAWVLGFCLIFQAFFSLSPLGQAASICDSVAAKMGDARDAEWKAGVEKLANAKSFATEADATLSKLITAKSPVVDRWMERNQLFGKSEDEIVHAWRKYYAEAQLSEFPPPEKKLRPEVEKFVREQSKALFPVAERKRFEKLFTEARASAIAYINKSGRAELKPVVTKMAKVKLFWPEEILKTEKKSPLEFFEWGIAYDPEPNVINVGRGALQYPNDETIFAVFVHELGHLFDSCRWSAYFSGAHPMEPVMACLRSPEATGAKPRDDSRLAELTKAGSKGEAIVASLKANPTCNRSVYPPLGLQADQLPETFADWFSAEVVAGTSYAKAGLRSDLCGAKDLRAGSSYLSNQDRLEKIYLAQPRIREALGLTGSGPRYCGPSKSPSSELK